MNEKEKLKETLSALFDNEAGKVDQLELRRLVRSLDENPDLIETYQRYTVARAVLRGESSSASFPHLLTNVRAALEQESMDEVTPAIADNLSRRSTLNKNWLKVTGRVAIAASVAVLAVYVVQNQLPAPDKVNAVAVQQVEVVKPNEVVRPAVSSVAELPVERNNRLLNPDVMTVSAGDRQAYDQPVDNRANVLTGCTISTLRADRSALVWEKDLPAGYVLCKQSDKTGQCESVAAKIGCYLN